MFSDDDLLPISALQHLAFCERQCMLIHLEGAWAENRLTAQGRLLHERVHAEATEMQDDRLITRGLALASRRLGLSGKADVVEFHSADDGILLPGRSGRWRPFPVEYKRGRRKRANTDAVQLCAQALCLEEMLETPVPAGALFYGAPHRRMDVSFDVSLRSETEGRAVRLCALYTQGTTPPPEFGPKCENCSLKALCLPEMSRTATSYVNRSVRSVLNED